MGKALFDIRGFKNTGTQKVTILDKDEKSIGEVSFKYEIK
jgi:hypothetical protein